MEYLKPSLLLLLCVVITCTAEESNEASLIENHVVHESTVFISPETSDFVGRPSRIKADSGVLYFSDTAWHRITQVDTEGNKQFSFGSQGRGPGEFEFLTAFWKFESRYLVYDYNGFKFVTFDHQGELISETEVAANPVNPDGFPPNIPGLTF